MKHSERSVAKIVQKSASNSGFKSPALKVTSGAAVDEASFVKF
jgi:hypothetical protein